ncbi:MAG: hypothetical protein Q4G67_14935, partial [Actinomycetia bacterium]|nr:hypothetical protein [Actinomycetes bacterium]
AGLGDPADDAGAFAAHALVAADRNAARGNAPAAAGLERLVGGAGAGGVAHWRGGGGGWGGVGGVVWGGVRRAYVFRQ